MEMHRYYIFTDGGQYDEFEAADVADALDQTDVPGWVRSPEAFERWLDRCGGYGEIVEDGVAIARVGS
jgi:hypothetical protein